MSSSILAQIIEDKTHNIQDRQQQSQCYFKIKFQHMKITKIGIFCSKIPLQVKILNLSHNYLKNLDKIEQFKNLQQFNVSYNKISQGIQFLSLQSLKFLKKLSIQGNSFLQSPLEQKVLQFLMSLNQVDLQLFRQRGNELKLNNSLKKLITRNTQIQLDQMSQHKQNQKIKKLKSKKIHEKNELTIQKQIKTNQESKFEIQNSKNQNYSAHVLDLNFQSPTRSLTYRYGDLDINLIDQSKNPDLLINNPSIIEKQYHDSYEIQFQFMSPSNKVVKQSKSKYQKNYNQGQSSLFLHKFQKESHYQYDSPFIQKKQLKLITTIKDFIKQQKQKSQASKKTEIHKIIQKQKNNQTQIQMQIQKNQNTKIRRNYKKVNLQKEKDFQEQTTIRPKIGSLYQSTRTYNQSKVLQQKTAYDLISKLLQFHKLKGKFNLNLLENMIINQQSNEDASYADKNQNILNNNQQTILNPISEILESVQKFQKFYYNSLTRLKPTFNLLYSPFHSLKVQQKDLLLSQLFKNHKQIFILLLKQFWTYQQTQNNANKQLKLRENYILDFKNNINDLQDRLQYSQKQKNMIKNNYLDKENSLLSTIQFLQNENKNFKKQKCSFNHILQSRQKLIKDVEFQYQKARKQSMNHSQQLKKIFVYDNKQEEIQRKRQLRLKDKYLKLILKKSKKIHSIKLFQNERKQIQIKRKIIQEKTLKKIAFLSLEQNLNKKKQFLYFLDKKNQQVLKVYFDEFKIQCHNQKLLKFLELSLLIKNKCNFLKKINQNYLKNKRLQKIKQIFNLKLKKKYFKNVFKNQLQQSKNKTKINEEKLKIYQLNQQMNTLKKYFAIFLNLKNQQTIEKQHKIEKILYGLILKNRSKTFFKISKYLKKEEILKIQLVKKSLIIPFYSKFLVNQLKYFHKINFHTQQQKKKNQKQKLKRFYLKLHAQVDKIFKKKLNYSIYFRQLTHKIRIKTLLINFKKILIINLNKKSFLNDFFHQFNLKKQIKNQLSSKKVALLKFIQLNDSLKLSKRIFLLFKNMSLCRQSKFFSHQLASLQEHYRFQQLKFKQSYNLNMLTIQQLNSSLEQYNHQTQYSKIQIQTFHQREMMIIQQKEKNYEQIKLKQEENFQLRKIIQQNERSLWQLQKKYEKSLDLCAEAMEEVRKTQILQKLNFLKISPQKDLENRQFSNKVFSNLKRESHFLYDTIKYDQNQQKYYNQLKSKKSNEKLLPKSYFSSLRDR